jgi:lipid-binding SYLF domain-containing protein
MSNPIFAACRHTAFAVVAISLAGCVAPDSTQTTTRKLDSAEKTFAKFRNDPEMKWFRDNMKNARAVIISPSIKRGGFIVGGSGGEAVVMAKDKTSGQWVGPAFYNMGSASVGLLVGGDVSEVVVLVLKEKAVDALLTSNFKVGGDASVAAGPVGIGASGTVNADMVSFSRAKGAFAGLSLDGAVIRPDADANAAFYGKPGTSPADVLVRGSVSNPEANALQRMVSEAAK